MRKPILKNKDFATMLYKLYTKVFNKAGNKDVFVSTEITDRQFKKYDCLTLTKEEVWAYDNRVIFISDECILTSVAERSREYEVLKWSFLLETLKPVYLIEKKLHKTDQVYNEQLKDFIIDKGFLSGLCENQNELDQWLLSGEYITVGDARKITTNILNCYS